MKPVFPVDSLTYCFRVQLLDKRQMKWNPLEWATKITHITRDYRSLCHRKDNRIMDNCKCPKYLYSPWSVFLARSGKILGLLFLLTSSVHADRAWKIATAALYGVTRGERKNQLKLSLRNSLKLCKWVTKFRLETEFIWLLRNMASKRAPFVSK